MKNLVVLIGHVGQDPQMKQTESTVIAKCSLATQDYYKGEKTTDWHNLVFFGKLAETVEKYVKKGSHIAITGKIKTKKYNEKYYTQIICNSLSLLSSAENKPKKSELDESNEGDNLPF